MPVIIDEVVTETMRSAAAPSGRGQAPQGVDTKPDHREALAAIRRAEARAERLRAD